MIECIKSMTRTNSNEHGNSILIVWVVQIMNCLHLDDMTILYIALAYDAWLLGFLQDKSRLSVRIAVFPFCCLLDFYLNHFVPSGYVRPYGKLSTLMHHPKRTQQHRVNWYHLYPSLFHFCSLLPIEHAKYCKSSSPTGSMKCRRITTTSTRKKGEKKTLF